MHNSEIEKELTGSVVMVTGGAGYIGAGIVSRLIKYNVKQIIVLDDSVSHLQDLTVEFHTADLSRIKLIPGNVKNEQQMRNIFSEYRPWIVFHTAGYQNIAFMENFPFYSLEVNIFGTKIMADLSGEYRVKRFVNLSSDVALNPVSIMGASKRIGEMYIQALAQTKKYPTRFASVRFGNLAGTGSPVLRLLEKQIEKGGPVTISHKLATYYPVSLEDTCLLIIEAGFTGDSGEIFQLDLGEPVSHYNLAKNRAVKNIKIDITGSKTEEKLYNSQGYNQNDLIPTLNGKIKAVKTQKHDYQTLNKQLRFLPEKLDSGNRNELIEMLMYIVSEYISLNPEFGQDNV
jgi:FlaA1/EpsC-like NDP-sugar epimerase